jgi:hypothetical protein
MRGDHLARTALLKFHLIPNLQPPLSWPRLRHLADRLVMALIVGAGLFVRSLQKLQQVDTGFVRENLLVTKLKPLASGNQTARLGTLYDKLLRPMEAIPGKRLTRSS